MTQFASFASEEFKPAEIVAGGVLRHKKITVANGEGVLKPGAVLGKVTADGKYKLSLAAANDGSEAPDVVLIHDVDATSAEVNAMAYYTGDFFQDSLTYGTGHTADSIREGFRTKGLFLI